jgi:hypothetical protein
MLDPNSNKSVDKHGQIFKKEDKKDVGDKDWDEALEVRERERESAK